jgi:hypothetical protein
MNMSRLYTYIVKVDTGLAPNPFWGWCTLAVCTPNHQGSAVKSGDWIVGFSSKPTGYKFIYAMEVDERIHMNDYFNDARFQIKKPQMNGNWKQKCGDNIYSQKQDGRWIALPSLYHEGMIEQDTRHPFVFVAKKYWYLGKSRVDVPSEFFPMIGGRGVRINHPHGLPERFKLWVQSMFAEGLTAEPLDAEESTTCIHTSHSRITCNNA